jgi:SAM-dependent methyltransferase
VLLGPLEREIGRAGPGFMLHRRRRDCARRRLRLGSLAQAVFGRTGVTVVIGIDRRHEAVAARLRVSRQRAAFHVGDARRMPNGDGIFDRCVALLVLNFLPDYQQAAAEMARVTRIGGTVAATTWEFAGLLTHRIFVDTAAALDPDADRWRDGFARPLLRAGELAALWNENGLSSVAEVSLTVWMEFREFADYWTGWAGPSTTTCEAFPKARRCG